MLPGFIKAICAPAATVYASCASAMTSPRALSPAAFGSRVMFAVMDPMTRLAIGAIAARYLSTRALVSASTRAGLRTKLPAASVCHEPSGSCTPFVTITFSASIVTNALVLLSSVKPMLVINVPKEPELVTTEFAPEELGNAHV